MTDSPTPTGGEPSPPTPPDRPYWIDDDGNVHGVVMTMDVDHVFEFNDQAVDLTGKRASPDQPAA